MPSFDAGQTGITPGVTITRPDTTEYAARTTEGFTEVPADSGSFDFAHPDPGTLLKFSFDALIGGVTYYASVWDDGLTPQAAAQAAIVAEGVATASALAEVDTVVDGIAADYAKTGEAATAATGLALEATAQAIKAHTDTLDAATGIYPLTFRLLLDSDGDGHPDDPAVGVGGVTCHLLAHETRTRIRESQTTDSQGYVYWHGLAAGTYDVDPDAAGYEGVTVSVTIPE